MEPSPFSSGQLTRAAGVHVETLRFYDGRRLLSRPVRMTSGHRRYTRESVDLLRVIRRAQGLGGTLCECPVFVDLEKGFRPQ